MKILTFLSRRWALGVLTITAGAVLLSACSSSSAPAGAGSRGPYVGSLSAMSGDATSSYTGTLPALDEETNERLRAGLETPSYVVPSTYDGAIFVPGGATPEITKYTVDEDGALVAGDAVSFGSLGVTNVGKAPVIGVDMVSAEKAYYYNASARQIVVWNPRRMELTPTTIDVGDVLTQGIPEGYVPTVFLNYGDGFTRQRDGLMFIPVSWRNWDVADVFHASAGLLVIDTEKDELVGLRRDERLADSIYTVMLESGDIYLFSGGLGVAYNRVRGSAAPGGAVRVRAGEDDFDPDYYLDLDAAVGDRASTTPVWAGGTEVYVRAYDEDKQPITSEIEEDPIGLMARQAWRFWKVDLSGAKAAREIAELPWTSASGYFYEIPQEKRTFLGVMAADFGSTTLYEATPAGFEEIVSVTGSLDMLARLDRRM